VIQQEIGWIAVLGPNDLEDRLTKIRSAGQGHKIGRDIQNQFHNFLVAFASAELDCHALGIPRRMWEFSTERNS